MNFDEPWWNLMKFDEKPCFHQISSNFIKVHFFFQNLDFFDELWWTLMKFDEKPCFHFHQISSKFIFFSKPWFFWWTLMKFDEKPCFHQISSNFIKVHFLFQNLDFFDELWWNLMKSDENHVFIKFYQSLIFIFKALNFLMSLLKNK